MSADDLRPPIAWEAVQSCFDDPIFNASRTAELLLSVGRPVHGNGLPLERVQDELREITAGFAFNRWSEIQPSASKQDAQAAKLSQALRLALETAGIVGEPTPEALLPMFKGGGLYAAAAMRGEPKGEAATMNALRAVWVLCQDADKMREVYAKRRAMNVERKGRPEGRAIKRLAADLTTLHWLTWLDNATISLTDDGEASSPFLRLFVAVQDALHRRGVDNYRSPESLAQAWCRLDDHDKLRFRSTWTAEGASLTE